MIGTAQINTWTSDNTIHILLPMDSTGVDFFTWWRTLQKNHVSFLAFQQLLLTKLP